MKKRLNDSQVSRRDALQLATKLGLLSPLATGFPSLLRWLDPVAAAATGNANKFLQIFCLGGWDVNLATDPVLPGSAKANGGKYQAGYWDPTDAGYAGAAAGIPGKSQLQLGAGLASAKGALADVNLAFVNGLFVEVTAHELAVNYLYTGQLSLSRSREYPATVAKMANVTGGFPAHVVFGAGVPVGDTGVNNPPLVSGDIDTFVKMLTGPYKRDFDVHDGTIDAAHTLLAALDKSYEGRLNTNEKASLAAWQGANAGLTPLYAKRFDQRLGLTDAQRTSFAAGTANDSPGARLGLAAQVLKAGVSRYVTVNFDGFDTHQSHLERHLPVMQSFAKSLAALVSYLSTAADPDSPSKKLLETTTVLVTSEFNRTPLFNAAAGTDHWQTGSALLFGRGVKDDVIVGTTGTDGAATNSGPGGNKLLPDHLAATILRSMGFAKQADEVSALTLSDLLDV